MTARQLRARMESCDEMMQHTYDYCRTRFDTTEVGYRINKHGFITYAARVTKKGRKHSIMSHCMVEPLCQQLVDLSKQ